MATTGTVEQVATRPRSLDRVSWGALLAGFFVGAGTLFLLLSLGAAVGFTAVDARDPSSWKAMGIGVGVWGGIAAIAAAFFSAWVTARLCTATDRGGGMLHGIALWGLTWAVALWMGAASVGGVIGSASGTAQSAGGALSGLSLSAVTDDAVQQANAWLRENGKPEVSRGQMEAVLQSIASDAMQRIRSGESPAAAVRQDALASSLARNTGLSRGDAEQIAAQLHQQVRGAISGAAERAPELAEAAASGASKGAWGTFAAALFTLLASAAGGATGVPERARHDMAALAPAAPPRPQHT